MKEAGNLYQYQKMEWNETNSSEFPFELESVMMYNSFHDEKIEMTLKNWDDS